MGDFALWICGIGAALTIIAALSKKPDNDEGTD
jgi:hypothetical protein